MKNNGMFNAKLIKKGFMRFKNIELKYMTAIVCKLGENK